MNSEEFDAEVKKLQEKVKKESEKNNTTVFLLSSVLIVYSRVYRTFCRNTGADWVKAVLAIPILVLTIVNLKYTIKLLK